MILLPVLILLLSSLNTSFASVNDRKAKLCALAATGVNAETLDPSIFILDKSQVQDFHQRDEDTQHPTFTAIYRGQKIFAKIGTAAEANTMWQLNAHDVGTPLRGVAPDNQDELFIIFEYIEGKLYSLRLNQQTKSMEANYQIPEGTTVNAQTLSDINHAFDTLNRLRLRIDEIQFLLTVSGAAYLIDVENFTRGASDYLEFNEHKRKLVLQGLTATPAERRSELQRQNRDNKSSAGDARNRKM